MQEGILTVLVDNETAVQNLQRLGQKFQYAVASQKLSEKEFEVRIEVKKQEGTSKEKEATCTVVFSSNKMGEGAEELGHTLIKSSGAFRLKDSGESRCEDYDLRALCRLL